MVSLVASDGASFDEWFCTRRLEDALAVRRDRSCTSLSSDKNVIRSGGFDSPSVAEYTAALLKIGKEERRTSSELYVSPLSELAPRLSLIGHERADPKSGIDRASAARELSPSGTLVPVSGGRGRRLVNFM